MCKILPFKICPNFEKICGHILQFECLWNFFKIHWWILIEISGKYYQKSTISLTDMARKLCTIKLRLTKSHFCFDQNWLRAWFFTKYMTSWTVAFISIRVLDEIAWIWRKIVENVSLHQQTNTCVDFDLRGKLFFWACLIVPSDTIKGFERSKYDATVKTSTMIPSFFILFGSCNFGGVQSGVDRR